MWDLEWEWGAIKVRRGKASRGREEGLEDDNGDVLWFEMRVAPTGTDVRMLSPKLVEN